MNNMNEIIRIMGKNHRITIPKAISMEMGIGRNDILSFQLHDDEIVIRKLYLCDGCFADSEDQVEESKEERSFLDFIASLSDKDKADMYNFLLHLLKSI